MPYIIIIFIIHDIRYIEYNQRDAINALKQFLIGQFVKFFFLIVNQPSMLQSICSETLTTAIYNTIMTCYPQ